MHGSAGGRIVSVPSAPRGTTAAPEISPEELQLATRNHGMPLEALRYDVTPVGLHYLLVHYDIPAIDPRTWRLRIDGMVGAPLELSLDDLRAQPSVTHAVTLECAGNGRARLLPRAVSQPWLYEAVGTAEWTGVPLHVVLEQADVDPSTVEVVFTGRDRGVEGGIAQHYQRSLSLDEARRPEVLLAHTCNGQPLPPQHGAPVRLVVPGWYGMASVKWLTRIEAVDTPFAGYQQARAYRMRTSPDEDGTPVDRIAVRSLLVPPGVPDFLTRRRHVDAGPCRLEGRAWSGTAPIERVEVSGDDGATWAEADLAPAVGPHAWVGWHADWEATPGDHVLCCRATDADGHTQPMEHRWNLGGYAVTTVHRVPVTVGPAGPGRMGSKV